MAINAINFVTVPTVEAAYGDVDGETNLTTNISSAADNIHNKSSSDLDPAWITGILRIYYIPTIALIGIIGNLISMLVFLGTRLKNHSSSYYLAAMAASDTLFLVFLFAQWLLNNQGLHWLRIDALNSGVGCKMMNYVMSTCASISVWLTVAYTSERCIAVKYPLLRARICTVGRAKVLITVVMIANTTAYLYMITTIGRPEGFDDCGYYEEYLQVMAVVSVVEALLMMALPFLMILFMNSMIVWKLWKLSNVFHTSETRNSSSRTCDGTGDTPLTPTPQLLMVTQSHPFPPVSTSFDASQTANVTNQTALLPSLKSDTFSSTVNTHHNLNMKSEAQSHGHNFMGNISTIKQCTLKQSAHRDTLGSKSPKVYQHESLKSNADISLSGIYKGTSGDRNLINNSKSSITGKIGQSTLNLSRNDVFEASDESGSQGKVILDSGEIADNTPKVYNGAEEDHSITNPTTAKSSTDGDGRDDQKEKVFIDVNIRVIIDSTNSIGDNRKLDKGCASKDDKCFKSQNQDSCDEEDKMTGRTSTKEAESSTTGERMTCDMKKVCSAQGSTKCHYRQKSKGLSPLTETQPVTEKKGPVTSIRHDGSKNTTGNITKMLLLISTMFIVLQLPSFLLRLYGMLSDSSSEVLRELQRIFNDLYFSHFSINFLIYSSCGSNFRQCLRQLLLSGYRKVTRHRPHQMMVIHRL